VAALTGFSGGTRVGQMCVIAGQVGTNQHVTIGDRTTVTARSGVTKSLPGGAIVAGVPARDYNAWRRAQVLYSRLPEIMDRIRKLERTVESDTNDNRRRPD
jgi:UDP-3-O-[3-hydroxymyristoyl] glucosamine N-acyltransferase